MNCAKQTLSAALLVTQILSSALCFAQSESITGKVVDASDNSPLLGAIVVVMGTSLGTTTDVDGHYRLSGIQTGHATIVFRYLGYESDTAKVEIVPGKTLTIDVKLKPGSIREKEIVVTAQLQGQAAAVNQQLTSNTIMNVVSKDKIQELPDQNAAESVGRLTGISVRRDAGEGTKVSVRGLDPKFTSVTVNGQRIPATDAQDRSVDLSMISSDMLAGIAVVKALTPDRDGDAVGGSVNVEMKKAREGFSTVTRLSGTYSSINNSYGNYRGSFSLNDRLFENALGIVATAGLQRAYRGSHQLDGSYNFDREALPGETYARILVDNLNIAQRDETRDRYGASVVLDYDLGNTDELLLSSLFGRTERDEERNRKRYLVSDAYVEYWLRSTETTTDLFANALSGKHLLGFMKLEWQAAYLNTKREMPFQHDSKFRELAPFYNTLVIDKGPELIPLSAKNDLERTRFYQDYFDKSTTDERDFTGQLDATIPFSLTSDLSGYVKFGGKYRDKERSVDNEGYFTPPFAIDRIGQNNPTIFTRTPEGYIKIVNFYDDRYVGELLNGYEYGPANALNPDKLDAFMNTYWSSYNRDGAKDVEDYTAGEAIAAAYVMTELNIGPRLMILPGLRFERTTTNYRSAFGKAKVDENGNVFVEGLTDSVGTISYDELLPMVHVRYKFTDWFDTRIAVTKAIARPDYFNLVPWERTRYNSGTIERGDPNLKNTTVWNYDIFFSFYNEYGLFTVGGYYKTLDDIDYIRASRVRQTGPTQGFKLTQPENSKYESKVYGIECEVQTNLRFLPDPFDGIVLSANYSYIQSSTYMPYLLAGPRSPLPPFSFTFIDTARESRMPGQAEHLANATLGYEKGKFSGRMSFIFQGNALDDVGTRAEMDKYIADFLRWDLVMQYKFIPNLSVIFSMNNITNLPESAFMGIDTYSTNDEHFGWTADLGIRFDL